MRNKQYIYGFILLFVLAWVLWLGQERFTSTDDPLLPIGDWVVTALDWTVENYRSFFQLVKQPFAVVLNRIQTTLVETQTVCRCR